MMNGRVIVAFRDDEGAVARILGVVERRGFALRGIAMAGEMSGHKLTLDVAARDAGRQFEVLDRQLNRLDGVSHVSIIAPAKESQQ